MRLVSLLARDRSQLQLGDVTDNGSHCAIRLRLPRLKEVIETSNGVALVRRRILVVDDYADARELYASCFVDAGFQVAEADNGETALDAITISRPDCIIMDLAMPIMDGWEAIDRIRDEPSTADILIIILSGHASVDDHRRARTVGVVNVLTKPCLPAALLERVRCLLS